MIVKRGCERLIAVGMTDRERVVVVYLAGEGGEAQKTPAAPEGPMKISH